MIYCMGNQQFLDLILRGIDLQQLYIQVWDLKGWNWKFNFSSKFVHLPKFKVKIELNKKIKSVKS